MAKQYTKNLIKREFLHLAEQKNLKNITIGELAERCEISRNTFYYHYDDIYMCVEEILQDEMKRIEEEVDFADSWEESLLRAASFILEHKKAALNIFRSLDKQKMDEYLFEVCASVMKRYVEKECRTKGIRAKEEDKILIINFYRTALVGLWDQWIQDGMVASPDVVIYRIGQLFDGNIARSLRISEKLNKESLL